MVVTEEKARNLLCPQLGSVSDCSNTCEGSRCMHWRWMYKKEQREDHSGGKEMIFQRGFETHRMSRREGPGGSTDTWILDAVGYCGLSGIPKEK